MYVFLPLSLFSIRQYNLYKKPLKRDFYDKSKKKKEAGDEGHCFLLMKWTTRESVETRGKLGFSLRLGLG